MGTEPPRRKAPGWGRARIYTVGHSTRSSEELIELLQAHGIQTLVDIRTVPRSRTNPQFNQDALPRTLAQADLRYMHLPRLGGLRRTSRDSPNTAWRNRSFRGYADYMATEAFADGLDRLVNLASGLRMAVMCAESLWWRCHRRLLADRLVLLDDRPVVHLFHDGRLATHAPTRGARRTLSGQLLYSAP